MKISINPTFVLKRSIFLINYLSSRKDEENRPFLNFATSLLNHFKNICTLVAVPRSGRRSFHNWNY